MKKIMIFGAGGMAGHMIDLYLTQSKQYDLYPIYHRSTQEGSLSLDVTNLPQLEQTIETIRPDIIINCMGILNDKSESNRTLTSYVNTFFPKYLEWVGMLKNIKIIHISTDCVFTGNKGDYVEFDQKDDGSMYGLSKNFGEIINLKDLTIRTSIIGPELKEGKGLFHWFMNQEGVVKGYKKVYWGGVTTLELAKAVDYAIKENLTGIYHLTNNEKISKFDLLKLIQKYFNINKVTLLEDDVVKCDKSIKSTRTGEKFKVSTYDEMIRDLKLWMDTHKNLYKHYEYSQK